MTSNFDEITLEHFFDVITSVNHMPKRLKIRIDISPFNEIRYSSKRLKTSFSIVIVL